MSWSVYPSTPKEPLAHIASRKTLKTLVEWTEPAAVSSRSSPAKSILDGARPTTRREWQRDCKGNRSWGEHCRQQGQRVKWIGWSEGQWTSEDSKDGIKMPKRWRVRSQKLPPGSLPWSPHSERCPSPPDSQPPVTILVERQASCSLSLTFLSRRLSAPKGRGGGLFSLFYPEREHSAFSVDAGMHRQMEKVWLHFWEELGLSHQAAQAAVTSLPAAMPSPPG